MTWSIIAKDRETGAYGVAVASRALAVGGLVPYGAGRVGALATQARLNPLYGSDGLRYLAEGRRAEEVVAILTRPDEGRAVRQLHVIDRNGEIEAYTGEDCATWAGAAAGRCVSVSGNTLAGPQVVEATLAAYEAGEGRDFTLRLISALEAGQAAGGDKRGQQSTGLKVWTSEPYAAIDLRVDDHPQPLAELRRLHRLAQERYIPFVAAMATRANPAGVYRTPELDRLIEDYRHQRRE
jgi:uncharacterized Ntn-hydrolase superfamily protein